MKSGKVGQLFNRDPKTIKDWTDEFNEFFTPAARGTTGQREYSVEDLIVINTIRSSKAKKEESETLRARLTAEDYDTELPPEATDITGDSAMVVYSQIKMLQKESELQDQAIEDLRQQLRDKDEHYGKQLAQKDSRIEELIEQMVNWKLLYKMLNEKQDKS